MSCCPPPVIVAGGGGAGDPGFLAVPLTLCDDNGPFLRRIVYDAETGAPTGAAIDTTLDGATPYAPVGTPTVCSSTTAPPTAQTAQLHRSVFAPVGAPAIVDVIGLASGPIESITVTVVAAGGAGITTVDGTTDLYTGESHTWSALGDVGAGSDQLVGPLEISGNPGTVVIITWTERL